MNEPNYFNNVSKWKRVSILEFIKNDNSYIWLEKCKLWADILIDGKKNLFSQVGIGARNAIFVIRYNDSITLFDAIKYQNKHYLITQIDDLEKKYRKITAAEALLANCKFKGVEYLKDKYNRPIAQELPCISFEACFTEKYVGYTETPVSANTETILVAITPKIIDLNVGDAIEVLDGSTVKNGFYIVQKVHKLDEYKNEYEVLLKDDV